MEQALLEPPLDRILARGPGALTDAELLSVLLRKPRSKALSARKAESLLALFGGISGLGACDPQMTRARNLGPPQAANLLAAVELARRLPQMPERAELIGKPKAAAAFLRAHFGRPEQQVLGALFVGSGEEPLGIVETFRGTARGIKIDTKTILREALCRNATGIFLFHIHPEPKEWADLEDVKFAKQMAEACETLGFELIDCLLIGGKNCISLRQERPW